MQRLVTDDGGRARIYDPRGHPRLLPRALPGKYAPNVAASWDSVIFDLPGRSRCSGYPPWSRCGAREPT